MRLISLDLSNFQGTRSRSIIFDGKDADIYGANGTGKTTIANAYTWLLYGKAATGEKGFTPKTREGDGEAHNLEHSVTAAFRLDDGSRVELKKALKESWKKKRGSATPEYTGNTVDYYIDGVQQKEKEYTAAVSAYFGSEDTMKVLTIPYYFSSELDWRSRRAMLLEVCGDVADGDVIAQTPELSDLPGLLIKPVTSDQRYTVEEYTKIAKARKSDINKELGAIPDRIDEAKRAMAGGQVSREEAEAALKAASSKLKAAEAELRKAEIAGDTTAAKALIALQTELREASDKYYGEQSTRNRASMEAVAGFQKRLLDIDEEINSLSVRIGVKRLEIATKAKLRESILAEYKAAFAETWQEDQETCPTCGRRLPEERIEEMRAEFNIRRSERLAEISERGKANGKDMIAALEAEITDMEQQQARKREDREAAAKKMDAAEQSIDKSRFEDTEEYTGFQGRIKMLQERSELAKRVESDGIMELREAVAQAKEEEQKAQSAVYAIEQAERQKNRVEELEAREKELGQMFEEAERAIYLCESFVRAKVGMLTSRINSKFHTLTFQLFTEQVNGGLAECCEALIPCNGNLIPYSSANDAAKVNAGFEIIETLGQHFGKTMPVMLDNAERVTDLLEIDTQVIRLIVSKEDEELRVELR